MGPEIRIPGSNQHWVAWGGGGVWWGAGRERGCAPTSVFRDVGWSAFVPAFRVGGRVVSYSQQQRVALRDKEGNVTKTGV